MKATNRNSRRSTGVNRAKTHRTRNLRRFMRRGGGRIDGVKLKGNLER